MDRFVWFVLLVVISHLATEFTRVTGYTKGPRQDVVMVNDSLIQPIKLQNQVLYPGQEYGLYEQPNRQYYNGNNLYSSYANNEQHKSPSTNVNKSNFLISLFKQFAKGTNNPNEQAPKQEQQSHMSNSVNSNNLLNLPPSNDKTFSLRPLIDSIFEIPLSTLRAVNELVGRLTGGYLKLQLEPQHVQQQQQATNYSYYPYTTASNSYYDMYRTATAALHPKTHFEILNQTRPTADDQVQTAVKPRVSLTTSTSRTPSLTIAGPQS